MSFWATRYSAIFVPPSPSSVTFWPAVLAGLGVDASTLEPALATPTSSPSTPISASVSVMTSFFLAAMMPLKDGKRGSLIFSLTLTTAGSVASRVKTPSSVSRSPVTLPPSTDSLRRWVSCGRPRYSAMMAGTAPPTPSVASLPAMTSSSDGAQRPRQRPPGLDDVRAVQADVLEVDRLVGPHREGLADRLGGALRARGEHGDRALAALPLADLQRLFHRAFVDLIQHRVGALAVQRVIAVGQLALRPGVWDLLDQDHDVRHECGSSSSKASRSGRLRDFGHEIRNRTGMLLAGNFARSALTP